MSIDDGLGQTHYVGDGCDPPHVWPSRWLTGRHSESEVKRLRERLARYEDTEIAAADEGVGLCDCGRSWLDHPTQAAREVERLRDGIRATAGRLDGIVNEARDDDPDDPAVWARHYTASTTASDLRALLDDRTEDHR